MLIIEQNGSLSFKSELPALILSGLYLDSRN